jgi:uncharacterized protein with PQ loop repeat
METSDFLNYMASSSIILANLWQIFTMMNSNETKALSWGMLILLSLSNILYAISGFIIKDFSLWFPDIILFCFVCVQILLKYYYERKSQLSYNNLSPLIQDSFTNIKPIKLRVRSFDL